jgi:arginine repressor
MKLKLIQIQKVDAADIYELILEYGEQEIQGTVSVHKKVVECIDYDDNLYEILHQNVGDAKNLNSAVFKVHKNIAIELPLIIGNF